MFVDYLRYMDDMACIYGYLEKNNKLFDTICAAVAYFGAAKRSNI